MKKYRFIGFNGEDDLPEQMLFEKINNIKGKDELDELSNYYNINKLK